MTSPQLEVLALLYQNYFENPFPFKGKRGSACQMLYSDYAQNPYRRLLNLKVDTEGTNLKGEFVLWNLIEKTNFVTFLKQEIYKDKKVLFYKLSPEGAKIGNLLASKEPENVELARQLVKKYEGELEELPISFYKSEFIRKDERIYFLEGKIKEFREVLKAIKASGIAELLPKLFAEYKI